MLVPAGPGMKSVKISSKRSYTNILVPRTLLSSDSLTLFMPQTS
jgi:hypothetical protein